MDFLELCTGHAAFRHPVFEKLAEEPLTTCGMKMFWFQMSPFCTATRTFGGLVNTLRQLRHPEAATLLEEIEESERGHAFELDLCAVKLVGRTLELTTAMNHFEIITPETEAMTEHFDRRRFAKTAFDAAHALGATYAVEVMSNHIIIPGEIRAFVESGYYGFGLSELPYLQEHAGELGVEANHQRLMESALEHALARGLDREEIERGIGTTLDAFVVFYDGLLRVSLICPHPA